MSRNLSTSGVSSANQTTSANSRTQPSPLSGPAFDRRPNTQVHVDSLLDSGVRALGLCNINDAISLWKQAVAAAAENSLTAVRGHSNLCVGYRQSGDYSKAKDASVDAWKILERGVVVPNLDSNLYPSDSSTISSGGTTVVPSISSPMPHASRGAGGGSGGNSASATIAAASSGGDTDAVVNLLVGVGLIGLDEGFALGTDDVGLPRRGGTLSSSRRGTVNQQQPHQQQQQQQQLTLDYLQQQFWQAQADRERERDSEEVQVNDEGVYLMRAVLKVLKRWLDRRRFDALESTRRAASVVGPTPGPKSGPLWRSGTGPLLAGHHSSSGMSRAASFDSVDSASTINSTSYPFNGMSSSSSNPTKMLPNQLPIDPALLVTIMDLCTNAGNLHFANHSYQIATIFHEACLDLAQDILTTFPLPPKPTQGPNTFFSSPKPNANLPQPAIKLSYLHAHTLMAKNRSMSHLGLCLGASGDVHRAVRFHQMAASSVETVAGPQPAGKAGWYAKQWRFTKAGVVGNLGRAQFSVGRYVEGMKGCVTAVELFAGDEYEDGERDARNGEDEAVAAMALVGNVDRAGLLKGLSNVGACWIEAGRLGCIVNVWATDSKKLGKSVELATGSSGSVENYDLYESGFTIPRPTVTSHNVAIPKRKHSAVRKSGIGANLDLGVLDSLTVSDARQRSPTWFADVLTGIRLLEWVVSEADKHSFAECIGLARFNIASGCIIIQQPYIAARLLMEAPYSWKEIMKHNSNSTPLPSSTSVSPMDDLSKLFSSQILGSVALFNMTQLLFVIASNKAMSSISKLGRPTSIESVSVDSISKILLWFSSESDKDSATLNLSRSIKEDSKSSDSEGGSIDPELLVVSLKLCLKLFDGSSVGPSELSRIKNANPGLASPRRTIFSNDYDPEPPSPVYDVGQQQQQLQAPSSLVSSPRQPVLVLPEKPKPYGSPTSYTTRICLALSRTLITVYAVSLDRTGESQRRVMSLRQEAQRWCGAEASAGLENAAFASGGSSAITQAAAGGGGGGGDRGERERSGSSNIGYGSRPSGSSASVFLGSSTTVPPKRSNTNENNKRRSMVVKGSALEGLLVSALSGTGEVHGNLAMEVGCVALEVETLAERGWKLEDLAVDRISNGCCSSRADETVVDRASLNTRKGLVQQLVRLASRRVRDGVIARMKMEEEHLDEALSPFLMKG